MSQERLETLKQELSSLREEFAGMKAQWDNEKKSVDHTSAVPEQSADELALFPHAACKGACSESVR